MKNFEKYIDEISIFIEDGYVDDCFCCPCSHECWNDDSVDSCADFFKSWAMKEVDKNE